MARRVRIVEDNEDIAFMLGAMLIDADLDVVYTTADFEQLLTTDPWARIDVAICDLMLGPVDGITILRYLRDEHPHIRRIAMTAALTEGVVATGVAHRVLTKPFVTADMIEAIG